MLATGRGKDAAFAAGLLLLVAVLYLPAVLGRATFFHSDLEMLGYPFRVWFAAWWRRGIFGWWCPPAMCGFPLFAEGQAGAMYPGSWLFALVQPPWYGMTLDLLLHLWWVGLGTYLWTRSLGACRVGAAAAALAMTFGGTMTSKLVQINVLNGLAWLPWAAYWFERRRAVPAGAAVGLQVLAGYPNVVVLTMVLLLFRAAAPAPSPAKRGRDGVGAGPLPRHDEPAPLLPPPAPQGAVGSALADAPVAAGANRVRKSGPYGCFGAWLTVAAIAACVGAVQLLPTLEVIPHSGRAAKLPFDLAVAWRMKLEHVPLLLAAGARGTPAAAAGLPELPYEWNCSLARLPLLLLVLGGVAVRRARPWAILAGVSFLFAFGGWPYRLLWLLPGFGRLQGPARLTALTTAAACAAIGLTVTELRRQPGLGRRAPALAGAILALAGLSALLARPANASAWGDSSAWLMAVVLLTAAAGLLARPPRKLFAPALLGLALADLWLAASGWAPLARPDYWRERDPLTAVVRDSGQRVHAPFWAHRELGSPHNLAYGVSSTSVLSPLGLRRTQEFMEQMEREAQRDPRRTAERLSYLRAGWVTADLLPPVAGRQPMDSLQAPMEPASEAWVESPGLATPSLPGTKAQTAPPIAATPSLPRRGQGEVQSVPEVRNRQAGHGGRTGAPPLAEPVAGLDLPLPPPWQGGGTPIPRCDAPSPNREVVRVTGGVPGLLLTAENAYPGWRATINSRPAAWGRKGLYRALRIPAGPATVRWVFDPISVRLGLFISLTSLAALCATGSLLPVRSGGCSDTGSKLPVAHR